jgi:hypothetical protein
MLTISILACGLFGAAFLLVLKQEKTFNLPLLAAAFAWPAAFVYQHYVLGCPFGACAAFIEMPFVWSALLMVTVSGLSKLSKMYNAKFSGTMNPAAY